MVSFTITSRSVKNKHWTSRSDHWMRVYSLMNSPTERVLGPPSVTETTTTTQFSSMPRDSRVSPKSAKHHPSPNATIRPVDDNVSNLTANKVPRKQPTLSNSEKSNRHTGMPSASDSRIQQQQQQPLSRKQPGSTSTAPLYTVDRDTFASQRRDGAVSASGDSTILSAHKPEQYPSMQFAANQPLQQANDPIRSILSSKTDDVAENAQAVVDRAKTNTKQTHIVESIAPGKVSWAANSRKQS